MDIQGHPNYLIYPDGRVFSKKRNIFMKISQNPEGYYHLKIDNSDYKIHRLIAIHYIPNPENKPQVDHINRITSDNRLENLRWVTPSENCLNRTKGYNSTITPYKNNTSGFKWITKNNNSLIFQRKYDKIRITKTNKSLPKLICFSFFYLLKYPLT